MVIQISIWRRARHCSVPDDDEYHIYAITPRRNPTGIACRESVRLDHAGPAVSSCPIGAIRAILAFWIIDSFLIGTANNAIRHRHRMHLVFAQERDDLGKDCPVHSQIAGFRKPSMQLCRRGLWGLHDADCDLGGAALVGAVESDRSDWLTAEASLSLFLEPLPWLLAQLHDHNSSSDSPLRQHIASAETPSLLSAPARLQRKAGWRRGCPPNHLT